MYSRAEDSRSWPKIVEVRWARNVSSAWAQTTATISSASVLSDDAASPADGLVDQGTEQAGYDETGRGREAVEDDEHARRPAGGRAAGCAGTRSTAPLSATGQPALGLAGLGVVLQRPALAQGVAAAQRGDRSLDRPLPGRDQLGRDHGRFGRPVAPGVGRGGEQVSHGYPPPPSTRGRACGPAPSRGPATPGRTRHPRLHRPGDHTAVGRAVQQQVLVGALGDGLVVVHQHDPVGVVQPQRRHGGHHGGAAATYVGDPLGDPRLGVRVDGGRRLDQHQDVGVLASARASTTRCRCPPDSPRPRSSSWPCQPPGRAS